MAMTKTFLTSRSEAGVTTPGRPWPDRRPHFVRFLAALILPATACQAAADELPLAPDLRTVDDGRATIHELYASYGSLLGKGFELDVITRSWPAGTSHAIPIIALRTQRAGPALWIISGIHGEEPAGPNAIARVIDDIADAGRDRAILLIPLGNPHGYARNWRYLNSESWSENIEAQSVGDSSHMLIDPGDESRPRAAVASSPEAGAITRYVFDMLADYPPRISIDLHEDDKIGEGYVYSQGLRGASEPLANEAVRVLRDNGVPIKLSGQTRFGEPIENAIIGPVTDSSIDELMSAQEIIVDGAVRAGPAAPIVLVFETPAGNLPLSRRIGAHEALLRQMLRPGPDGE